jgi:hypothetical protein
MKNICICYILPKIFEFCRNFFCEETLVGVTCPEFLFVFLETFLLMDICLFSALPEVPTLEDCLLVRLLLFLVAIFGFCAWVLSQFVV